jgi:cytochrome c556
MRIIGIVAVGLLLAAGARAAQAQDAVQPVGSMSELMVSMIHPATNDLLMAIYRGGPKTEREWRDVQRNAVLLGESGNVLMLRNRNQGDWVKYSRMLSDAGAAAYKAARAKDAAALAAVDAPLNASCTSCHKQFRPNVHPRTGTN